MTKSNGNKPIAFTERFRNKVIDTLDRLVRDKYTLFKQSDEQQELIEGLSKKITGIENNLEELTKSLARGSYPVKLAKTIKVTESLIPPKIEAIEINKFQLIETYNQITALLSAYIIPVTLTPDSYRNLKGEQIFLERTIKGNYWAITTKEKKQYQYWLVPNPKVNFNIHKLKSLQTLFNLEGNYNSSTTEFILQEPAILSLLPNNKQWKLLRSGVLVFGKDSQSSKNRSPQAKNIIDDKQSQINNRVLSTLTTFKNIIEELNTKILDLESKSEISEKSFQRERDKLLKEKKALKEQLQNITQDDFKNKIPENKINNKISNFNPFTNKENQNNIPEGNVYNEKLYRDPFEDFRKNNNNLDNDTSDPFADIRKEWKRSRKKE